MNRLATLKRILLAVVALVLLSECHIAYYDDPPSPEQKVMITGDSKLKSNDFIIHDHYQDHMETSYILGRGNSSLYYLKENIISLSHLSFLDKFNNILVENGTFKIAGTNGDYITGTYHGGGQGNQDSKFVSLELIVTGRFGQYLEAKGTINANVIFDPSNPKEYNMLFSGIITLPLTNQNPG